MALRSALASSARNSAASAARPTVRSTCSPCPNSRMLLLRLASSSAAAASSRRKGSTSADGFETASSVVWGLEPCPAPNAVAVHVAIGSSLSFTRIVPPASLAGLHPDTLDKNRLQEFLVASLVSKRGRREGINAVAFSATYLPSQLDMLTDLASKQFLATRVLLSSGSNTCSAAMHVVFNAREPEEDDDALAAALQAALGTGSGRLQPLAPERLQVARMAEQALQRQLRLFDPASWSSALQASVMGRKSPLPYVAVRSLMAPAAAAAAQKLVERMPGLRWIEVEADTMRALASAPTSPGSSAARTSLRRARRSSAAAAGSPAAGEEAEQREQPIIVISTIPLTAEEAAEQVPLEAFTDYEVRVEALLEEEQGGAGGVGGGGVAGWLPSFGGAKQR